MEMLHKFTLPAGTICKRGGIPFELAADTTVLCHPDNWPLTRDGFKPSVSYGDQQLVCSHSQQLPDPGVPGAAGALLGDEPVRDWRL